MSHESHTTSVDVLNTFNENKSNIHLAIQYTRCSHLVAAVEFKWMWSQSHFCDMFLYFMSGLPVTPNFRKYQRQSFSVAGHRHEVWAVAAWWAVAL